MWIQPVYQYKIHKNTETILTLRTLPLFLALCSRIKDIKIDRGNGTGYGHSPFPSSLYNPFVWRHSKLVVKIYEFQCNPGFPIPKFNFYSNSIRTRTYRFPFFSYLETSTATQMAQIPYSHKPSPLGSFLVNMKVDIYKMTPNTFLFQTSIYLLFGKRMEYFEYFNFSESLRYVYLLLNFRTGTYLEHFTFSISSESLEGEYLRLF